MRDVALWAEKLLVAPRLDAMLVNSRAAGTIYRRRVSRRVPVACIHNGVGTHGVGTRDEMRREIGLGGGDVAIGAVGRLVPVKGLAFLVEAFAEIAPSHPSLSLHLIGDGPLRGELETLAAGRGVGGRVRFHGEQDEPRRFLPAFDIFVLPSLSEGLPNALLEAMACGLPCVASKVGGIPEIGPDAGVEYVAPGDARALARAIDALVRDAGRRARDGAAAARTARTRFPLERMLLKTVNL